jgi:hypothetical protein
MADPWPEAVQRRNKLRPRPLGMGSALLALVVAVVIFIGLVLWYTVNPAGIEPRVLSDLEPVHSLATECHERHPQIARGAQVYLGQALPMLERARFEPGFDEWAPLEELFCRALAVDPDSEVAVLGWVELTALGILAEPPRRGDPDRAWSLLLAVHRLRPQAEGLPRVGAVLHRARSRANALDTEATVR